VSGPKTNQDAALAPTECLEQAAQTLSEQALTLSWRQTTAHSGLLYDTKKQASEKHIEHCFACPKSNEKAGMSKDVIVTIPEA
jgi:hypothetical protein